jgi:hypothetical protein
MRLVTKLTVFAAVGTCLGVLFLLLGFKYIDSPRFQAVFNFIHAPAFWIADVWSHKLHLPPRGEAGFAATPMVGIVLQWTAIGLAVGAGVCCFSQLRKVNN